MLDTQGEATFIIIDAPLYGCAVPQATLDILGDLRRSQKAVSPLWIDKCVRHGTILSLERYVVQTSRNVPPTLRQPAGGVGEPPVNTQVPHKKVEDPSDVEISYKQASFTLEDTVTLDRKRRLSQSDVHLEDDVVRATGITRKAVDPRVRPRPGAERQASNSELSTTPAASISRPSPATCSPGVFGEKRPLCRSSVYDRPDATTLNLPAKRIDLGAMKDDLYRVANGPRQVPPRGVNMISHTVRSKKPSFSVAAAEIGPPLQSTRAYRPDTPPLPPSLPTSSADHHSHDLPRESVNSTETIVRRTGSLMELPRSSAKGESDPDWVQRIALAIPPNESTMNTTRSQTSAHGDHNRETSPTSPSEVSDYVPSSDDEAMPHSRTGGSRASSRSRAVLRSRMFKSDVKSARSNVSGQEPPWTPRRASSSISLERLATLVDELDMWLNTEPTNTRLQFFISLDTKVSCLS